MDAQKEFPLLVVKPNGASGIEIRAEMGKKYDCVVSKPKYSFSGIGSGRLD